MYLQLLLTGSSVMKNNVEVVQSTPEHLVELTKRIRHKDAQESLKLGFEPLVAITQCFKYAVLRKTVLINGEVAAVFGVTGSFFAEQNTLYLITSEVVNQVSPLTFVKIYLQELEKMISTFNKLVCYVDVDYKEAVRLLELVGFEREQTLNLNGHEFYLYSLES